MDGEASKESQMARTKLLPEITCYAMVGVKVVKIVHPAIRAVVIGK